MAFILDPQTGKITFGAVADGTNDSIALDLASQFGVSEDFNDNYTSDNWTDIGTGFGVNNGVMELLGIKGAGNNGSGFDLGAGNVSDTNFVLRFKFTFINLPTIVTDDSTFYLSIDSADQSVGSNTTGHDALTLQIAKSAGSQLTRLVPFHSDGGEVVETSATALLADGTGPTYYIEIKRTSTTSATWTLFSDSTYTAVIATTTATIPVGITGLRHIVWRSRSDTSSGVGEITAEIDDVQFWNSKSTPIIESTTSWTLRFKYDLTVVNDSGSAVNVGLFIGLGDQDAISGSATSQDGFFLLTSADNGIDTKFRVQTPDNTAPEGTLDDSVFTTIPSVATRFIEMIRDSASQTTVSIYSDATFTTLIETQVQAGVSGSDNLKYLKLFNAENQISPNTLDGSIDDITFTSGVQPLTETFRVGAILATIAFGNDITWSFREHDSSNLFNIDYDYFVGGSPPSFITRTGVPSSIGTSHLFKVFKKSEMIGSDIKVTWSNPQGGSNRIVVSDGAYDPSSLVDFPSNSGRLIKGIGGLGTSPNYTLSAFATTVLPVASINYAGSTEEFITVFININDTQTGSQSEYVIKDIEVSLRGKWQFDDTPVITQVLIGTQQDYGYLNASSVASPPPRVEFTINAILATIAFGNDLTWQYREHETNATFPPAMFWTDSSAVRMFSNPSSVGSAYTLKIFKLSEITGSDIKVTWERTLGNSGAGQIAIYDGVINAESLVDIPPLAGIPNTLLGSFNSLAFFSTKTDTLLASNIDYAGATGTHVTLIIRNNDGSTSDSLALRIFEVDVTLRGKWDFTSGLVITNVRGNQLVNFTDVDDFGYINASSVTPPPVILEFTINAIVIPRACSPWLNFANGDGSVQRLTRNAGGGQCIEFPKVNVDTFVTGFKIRLQRVGGANGGFNARIFLYPPSQGSGGAISLVGTSVTLSGVAIPTVLTETTAVFDPPVKLVPNQRYMIGFSEGLDSGTGINYETRITKDTQYQYAFQIPNSGTPPNWINLLTTDRQIAGDILVLNGDFTVCTVVDAILTKVTAWQFREQRTRNDQGPSGGAPIITFVAEPPRFKIDSGIGSIGFGWMFKTFLLSDITGSSITVDWAGTGVAQIRVYDGRYERFNFGDFIPNESPNSPDPIATTILKGEGLLGDIETISPSSSTTLDGASINYAGALLDEVTVFIKLNDVSNSVATNLNITSITIGAGVGSVYNFNLVNPYTDPLTNVSPADGWVSTDNNMPVPTLGKSIFNATRQASNDTVAQDFSTPSRFGSTLGTNYRLRLLLDMQSLTQGIRNTMHWALSDSDQTANNADSGLGGDPSENSHGIKFDNEQSGLSTWGFYEKVAGTLTFFPVSSPSTLVFGNNFIEIERIGSTVSISKYTDATFTVLVGQRTGIPVTLGSGIFKFWKWGNEASVQGGAVSSLLGEVQSLELTSGGGGFNLVQEETGTEFDWGFVDATSITDPSFTTEFTVDACLGLFVARRSIIGDLIIKVLQANPSGLTGLQITEEVRLLRPTSKTSRIKNWIGFLDTKGIIVDDGSNPDWYKTIWTLV